MKSRALLVAAATLLLTIAGTATTVHAAQKPSKPRETVTLKLPKRDVTNVARHPGGRSVDLTRITGYRDGGKVFVTLRARNVLEPTVSDGMSGMLENAQSWCVQLFNKRSEVQSFCATPGAPLHPQSSGDRKGTEWGDKCIHSNKKWTYDADVDRNTVMFAIPAKCFRKRGAWSATAQGNFYAGISGVPTNTDDAGHRFTKFFADTPRH